MLHPHTKSFLATLTPALFTLLLNNGIKFITFIMIEFFYPVTTTNTPN